MRCPELAEDAVHDAFARLFAMQSRPANLKAYAFRTVRNAAIDTLRRRAAVDKLKQESWGEYIFNGRSGAGAPLEAEQTKARLVDAMARLSNEEREVIVMHLYAELRFREMAEILERPQGTVVSWYRRGLEKLRRMLEEEPL